MPARTTTSTLVETCGLLTAEVQRGFELARDERLAAEALDDDGGAAARIKAGVAFDLEWQNRGLGGLAALVPSGRQGGGAGVLRPLHRRALSEALSGEPRRRGDQRVHLLRHAWRSS